MNTKNSPEKILRAKLQGLSPEHDTPVGLIHPYWARKPLNIVQMVIDVLSERGEIVGDPFMGSGTTVFAALSRNRSVIASDLNPLAVFIVLSILSLRRDTRRKIAEADKFVRECAEGILPWFRTESGGYVERERFVVNGSYENGDFKIDPVETVIKDRFNDRWTRRRVIASSEISLVETYPDSLIDKPVRFHEYSLIPNSRIAVPNGARLSHFFAESNRAAINYVLLNLNEKKSSRSKQVLRFVLSSALPLLRLSDKKASSQWPYWRPRQMLTSRNPAIILEQRLEALRQAAEWVCNVLPEIHMTTPDQLKGAGNAHAHCSIRTLAAQEIFTDGFAPESVDLIVTDPPYSDQAPYLEYSYLWVSLLGLKQKRDAYGLEIVKTDAPSRVKDSSEYLTRLCAGLHNCCKLLKRGKYLVLFYQDTDLRHWAGISKTFRSNGLRLCDVIPMPKQRRSIKTVTSPGNTLDGDLICVFKKDSTNPESLRAGEVNVQDSKLEQVLKGLDHKSSYFERYAEFVKFCLQKEELVDQLSRKENQIPKWLNKRIVEE